MIRHKLHLIRYICYLGLVHKVRMSSLHAHNVQSQGIQFPSTKSNMSTTTPRLNNGGAVYRRDHKREADHALFVICSIARVIWR
uniref:Uncharacterized protein n=1 Tax=Cyclopterus lumpus TaxID=8103 RepID=A0A8C2XK09_CYCLU